MSIWLKDVLRLFCCCCCVVLLCSCCRVLSIHREIVVGGGGGMIMYIDFRSLSHVLNANMTFLFVCLFCCFSLKFYYTSSLGARRMF